MSILGLVFIYAKLLIYKIILSFSSSFNDLIASYECDVVLGYEIIYLVISIAASYQMFT